MPAAVCTTALHSPLLILAVALLHGCGSGPRACPDAPPAAAAAEPAPGEAPIAAPADSTLEVAMPRGQDQVVVRAADTAFGPCPPSLPKPCEMAVLEGDPQARTLFTVRFRVPAGFEMPLHTHPSAERVTIVSGKVGVGFGTVADRAKGKTFTAGDYYINAADAVHYVWTEEPSVIQIHGIGPWKATPFAPAAQ